MNKYEREQAVQSIAEQFIGMTGERAVFKLECCMVIRCNNTVEAVNSVIAKLKKGFRVRNPHISNKPKPTDSIKQIIDRFVKDGDLENAREIAKLHNVRI